MGTYSMPIDQLKAKMQELLLNMLAREFPFEDACKAANSSSGLV
jgi:hypothetical protein